MSYRDESVQVNTTEIPDDERVDEVEDEAMDLADDDAPEWLAVKDGGDG